MNDRDRSLPEWQVELAIVDNLSLIRHPKLPTSFDRIENQYFLKNKGRYIDILLRNKNHFYIIELKGVFIDQSSIITKQLLDYKDGIMKEKNVSLDDITCILASPFGFSNNILELAKENSIILIKLDEQKIYSLIPKRNENYKLNLGLDLKNLILTRILQRRLHQTTNKILNEMLSGQDNYINELISVQYWLGEKHHNDYGKKNIAKSMFEISKYAPIMAHEINDEKDFQIKSNEDMWWWLIYSILDKRGNASSFYLARDHLINKKLFYPQDIIELIESKNDTFVIELMSSLLSESGISTRQNMESLAKGIIEAAILLKKFKFNFENILKELQETSNNDNDLFEKIWNTFLDIFGVGPRICSQIIRGLILKGGWNLKNNNILFLEEQKHNVFLAKQCLRLLDDKGKFKPQLQEFSDIYLNGNNAVLSHVLWYIRKRYLCTSKKPLCEDCPMSGYCNVYLNNILKFDKITNQIKMTDFLELNDSV